MRSAQILCAVVIAAVATSNANAMFMMPQAVPADRLIANTEAFIRENPENAEAWYTLGRIHYLVFANQALFVGALRYDKEGALPSVAPDWLMADFIYMARRGRAQEIALQQMGFKTLEDLPQNKRTLFWETQRKKEQELVEQNWKPEPLGQKNLLEHAVKAQTALKKAISMSPDKALYHLTLASLYDQYSQYAQAKRLETPPDELNKITPAEARDAYLKAYDLAIAEDLKSKHMPKSGIRSLLSHEAGKRWLAMATEAGNLPDAQRKRLDEVRENVQRLEKLPTGAVTPIIFSLEPTAALSNLLAQGSTTLFDLDGNGVAERWPWVRPNTGILVWDPAHVGKITSGRQLFGSASWWLLFSDGYAALNALDNNRDGRLSGSELNGIAAWFDRNSNGVSDPGEVTPVRDIGVCSISTRATSDESGVLTNSAGITMRTGLALPTYDWVVTPTQSPAMPLQWR